MVSQTKSRKIPTRKHLPLFFASRYEAMPDAEVQAALMKRIREQHPGMRRGPFNSTPHGGQFDFVWLSARTPHGAYVW